MSTEVPGQVNLQKPPKQNTITNICHNSMHAPDEKVHHALLALPQRPA
jgi:hypothetical protein